MANTKVCTKCKRSLSNSDFYKKKQSKDGLSCWCKSCSKKYNAKHPPTKAAHRKTLKKYRQSPKGKLSKRKEKYKRNYGIMIEDFDKMLEEQKGLCAICGKPETWKHYTGVVQRLGIDHRHSDNLIRGLLCHSCNLLIDNAKEDIKILLSAVKYLKKWGA